jgi:hypothetical protein
MGVKKLTQVFEGWQETGKPPKKSVGTMTYHCSAEGDEKTRGPSVGQPGGTGPARDRQDLAKKNPL